MHKLEPGSYIWAHELIGREFNDFPDELQQLMEDGLIAEYKSGAERVAVGSGVSFNEDMFDSKAAQYIRDKFYAQGSAISMTENIREQIGNKLADLYEKAHQSMT